MTVPIGEEGVVGAGAAAGGGLGDTGGGAGEEVGGGDSEIESVVLLPNAGGDELEEE